ncbi:leucine-rich repeat-containing protein 75B-like [Actinia tenebrosa]|uniref:Leucine-rich repeat-containing protein 75B-like n=1 Tax=Actinia tenebrosa TaxID=6105 RepID=A0A6P8HHU1_ACTTE|nr:leucine-rich repeat-containing protein 75B-like [Actinia tenebrosa]
MGQVCCCTIETVEIPFYPFHERVHILRKIEDNLERGYHDDAKYLVTQLCKNLQVTRETKLISNLGLVDLLQLPDFLVDRQAHDFLRRLQEALSDKNIRHAVHVCKHLISYFNFKITKDNEHDIDRVNRKSLASKNRHEVRITGVNLAYEKNFKLIKAMISRNPKLRKITISFCGLTTNQAYQLLVLLSKEKHLYYIGFRGNELTNRFVNILQTLLEDSKNFPVLCWVELKNNNRINWLPEDLMILLRKRWRKRFRDSKFCKHDKEDASMMAAIEAVVLLNERIKRHALEQKDNPEQQQQTTC